VRANTVQEQGALRLGKAATVPAALPVGTIRTALHQRATVQARFLIVRGLALLGQRASDDTSILIGRFRECEFYGSGMHGYNSSYYLTNCLVRVLNAGRGESGTGGQRDCGAELHVPLRVSILHADGSGARQRAEQCVGRGDRDGHGLCRQRRLMPATATTLTQCRKSIPLGGTGDKSSVAYKLADRATGPVLPSE